MKVYFLNISKLVERGVWAENCLCSIPTITPPNWTTIATGASVGTHEITCFHLPNEGENLNKIYQAFNSREVKAEYIWEAAEKVGLRTLVCTYHATWPPRIKNGYQINGAGGGASDYRDKTTGDWGAVSYLGDDQLYSTEPYPQSTQVKIKEEKERFII